MYSLPVNARTWPALTDARAACSMALSHSSSVNLSGSAPATLSMNPIVSRISESRVIRPLRSGRVSSSSKLPTSLVIFGVVGDAGQAALPRARE